MFLGEVNFEPPCRAPTDIRNIIITLRRIRGTLNQKFEKVKKKKTTKLAIVQLTQIRQRIATEVNQSAFYVECSNFNRLIYQEVGRYIAFEILQHSELRVRECVFIPSI